MYQFFVDNESIVENFVRITGPDVNHIGRVLRMKTGERIRISYASMQSYFCHITEISPDEVYAEIDSKDEYGTELPCNIVLFQGLPKADKMELIIQKAVELGVSEIVPVAMKNSIVKLDEKKVEGKIKRWQAIAESAAKQSKRSIIPTIQKPMTWKSALQQAAALDCTLLPYENQHGMIETRHYIGNIIPGQCIGIIVGPEGGFSDKEIADAELLSDSIHKISLGRRILRTETAGLATLAMIIYELDK